MEPADNQKSDYSWYNNRELLPILEQERRRRKVAPEEKTPLFPRPYKTNKEDELSRRIKKLLGEWDPKVSLSHECPLNPIWIPRKPKPRSRAPSRRPASSKTNPYEDIWREPSPESLGIRFHPEQNYNDSNEGVSNRRSEAKAPQSKILPELVKKKKPIDVSSTEKTLKVVEKTSSLGPPRVFQSQHKRVAPAQPSNSESGSTKNCHSPSVSAFPRAPAPKPTVDTDVPFIEGILKVGTPQYQISMRKPVQIHGEVDPSDSGKGNEQLTAISPVTCPDAYKSRDFPTSIGNKGDPAHLCQGF
ncbi:hypothetical protein EK904_000674 [Melospiza melodia maxima]|nr:hypothetical protein EK904_000674 [Melospiza melodia maxima]